MRRFIAASVIIAILLIGAIGASLVIGRHSPASLALQRFRLDSCASLCVLGTTLGKTTFLDALTWFRRWQGSPDAPALSQFSPDFISLHMMDPDGKVLVDMITITFSGGVAQSVKVEGVFGPGRGTIPSLGDLISVFGSPLCAQSDPNPGSSFGDITIDNPRLGVEVQISGWIQMDWYTPVGAFSMAPYTGSAEPDQCACQRRWRGPLPDNAAPAAKCLPDP